MLTRVCCCCVKKNGTNKKPPPIIVDATKSEGKAISHRRQDALLRARFEGAVVEEYKNSLQRTIQSECSLAAFTKTAAQKVPSSKNMTTARQLNEEEQVNIRKKAHGVLKDLQEEVTSRNGNDDDDDTIASWLSGKQLPPDASTRCRFFHRQGFALIENFVGAL